MKLANVFLGTAGLTVLFLTSCSKLGELSADNFTVTPNPLVESASKVPATIDGRFPVKYMKKKAVVTVTPELRYAGNAVQGQSATFQGEKAVGNNQTISYKMGGNYTMKTTFDYLPEMAQSELYLTFNAAIGKKTFDVPAVKVADGVLATSQLVYRTVKSANTCVAPDAYQQIIAQHQDAQIKYLINQSRIRTSELSTTSIQDFVKVLRDIKADQKSYALDNIEVSAYASPDGALSFNEKVASGRQATASDYVNTQLKKISLDGTVDTKYTAEDWEGFQEIVAASNIQDKDVILRVLNMYKDPEEREAQIRNMSVAFRELADEVLPELRRARLTINYKLIGRTDAEIKQQFKDDASKLSVEELLYGATLTNNPSEQKQYFETAARLFPNDYRAYNGLAQVAIAQGDLAAAKAALQKAGNKTEANANAALIAISEGNLDQAEALLGKALTAANYNEVLGNLQIARGNWTQAAQALKGVNTNSAALAQILTKDYASAKRTLDAVAAPDAMTSYLKAIAAARTGDTSAAKTALQKAISLDSSLAEYAAKDMEFILTGVK
ncbi:MAG: tetratricopeptide repeat protein [Alloprevotella sp.]